MIKKIFAVTLLLSLLLSTFSVVFAQEPYPSITDIECDSENPCSEGKECISFPDIGNRCAEPNPCSYYRCPEGTECFLAESYPAQVICSKTQDVDEEITLDENIVPEDLETGKPMLLPNNHFYFFKEWTRKIHLFVSLDPVNKIKIRAQHANERLIELKELIDSGATKEEIMEAAKRYKEEISEIEGVAVKIKEKASENEEVGKFLDKFTQHQALHNRVLQKIEGQVPEEVSQRIRETREEHLRKFGGVMTKLEEKERIQERIENNLQEVKGSQFKEFKNLEILEELEEVVPEEVKESIKKAKENSLKRLEDTAEKWSEEDQEKFKEYIKRISGNKEKQLEIIENLKSELPETSRVREKIRDARRSIIEIIPSELTKEGCPKIEPYSEDFCENGRILFSRDQNGCIDGYRCIEIEDQEKNQEQNQGENIQNKEQRVCITLWDPVCGVNGKIYSNSCFAELAGVEIDYEGTCKEEKEELSCEEKCESLGYESGICRNWTVTTDAEMGCKETEIDVGETKDCKVATSLRRQRLLGAEKTCCCQR